MAKETQIGSLVINLTTKIEAFESGLKVAQNKLKEIEDANKKVESSNKSVDSSWIAVAATATAALAGIKSAISAAVDEYKSYTQAMESLSDVSDYTNQKMSDMSKVMNKYSSIMNKSDIATTIKNFSLMGFTVEQTDQMIQALTNSAIRNRNANYTVSEAVRIASEGYRQGLSTLSDSAGVTENLSVMLDNYAASLGKTASKLTEAEKNQAYLNRTMYAAEPFAGAMDGYLDSLAGKQGLYAQSMRDTQVAFAEALEPTMSRIIELGTGILGIITNIISSHPNITAGFTTFAATLAALILVITAVTKAIEAYKKSTFAATVATQGLSAAIMANPLGLIITVLAAVVGGVVAATNAVEGYTEKQNELNEAQRQHNSIMNESISLNSSNIDAIKKRKEEIDAYITDLNEYDDLQRKINTAKFIIEESEEQGVNTENLDKMKADVVEWNNELTILGAKIIDTSDSLKGVFKIEKDGALTTNDLIGIQEKYNKVLKKTEAEQEIKSAMDLKGVQAKQKDAAQTSKTATEMQNYLNVIKEGKKGSTDYQKAQAAIAKEYPELVNSQGVIIDRVQDKIDIEKASAEQTWNEAQNEIQAKLKIIEAFILLTQEAENNAARQAELASFIGISYENIIPTLTAVKNELTQMSNLTPETLPGITPITTNVSSGSSSYSNEALDNYKRQIEHKKALDQITLKEEIAMYETALREYANTADEKMELREKIYELNKELAKKEQEILEQQTEDYENYIQEQKNLRGAAYDVVEQTRDYDKIIRMHKNYLDQIMKDERLSLEERKEIYREELQTIRDYEQQKRDLRVEAVDNTVTQLTNAITKQLEEAQKKDKEAIDKNLEEVERWKNARIDAINEEYDARIEAINKELDALNKAEEQKSRDEEDAEFERKKLRLEQLIAYEHDATTKANYQKELDKLVAEYQKTLDARALQDKKDALNEQKELLQKEQDEMTQAVEDEADRQKEVYDKQLEDLEKYYEEQIDMAQETAEKMLLNVGQNQYKILNLLKSYGDKYEITGQTLGEKLAQGINDGLSDKIQSMVQKIQDTIDANLESKIKEWTSSNYRYEEGQGKPVTQNITVNQTNNIEQLPELPSETYRKLNNISENLAAELSGV